jgi:methylthioribose-1-phosphate isomerase
MIGKNCMVKANHRRYGEKGVRFTKTDYLPIEWLGNRVRIIDQTRLPHEEVYLELNDYRDVAAAIRELKIRGAPAIGVAGAYAVSLGAREIDTDDKKTFLQELLPVFHVISVTRPTARNLFFALERLKKIAGTGKSPTQIKKALIEEAVKIHEKEAEATCQLSLFGAEIIQNGWTILTHCNTGPLATTGYGTALGVIITAYKQGKNIKVLATETRPLLQGARLTTWELKKTYIPVTLITDSMAGYFIKLRKVDCIITGADSIAANGDTANKIGTYTLAVLAKENRIPFYIAAPTSTIDPSLKTGNAIPIEERNADEVTHLLGMPIAPEGVIAANPAFDVTPHRYITAIITEKGIIREPFVDGIKSFLL